MFYLSGAAGDPAPAGSSMLPGVDVVRSWTQTLRSAPRAVADDAGRVDLLRALEELACAAAGAQGRRDGGLRRLSAC